MQTRQLTQQEQSRRNFYVIAYIFHIISTIIMSWLIIPLIWSIPMTIATKRAFEEVGYPHEKSHIGLGVASIFVISILAGIFTIIAASSFNSNQNVVPVGPTKTSEYEVPKEETN